MNDEIENEGAVSEDEQMNPFHKLVMQECEMEILSVTRMLSGALKAGSVEDVCKASETLARIKQNAILTAANTQAILMKATSAVKNKISEADMEKLAGKFSSGDKGKPVGS